MIVAMQPISIDIAGTEPRLAADLAALACDRASEGSVLTLEELLDLYAKRQAVGKAFGQVSANDAEQGQCQHGVLPRSITLPGGLTLHQRTIAVEIFLERIRAEKWLVSQAFYDALIAYLHAQARDSDALAALATQTEAERIVAAWGLTLTVTTEELDLALWQLDHGALPDTGPGQKKSRGQSIGATHSEPLPPSSVAQPSTGSSTSAPHMPSGASGPLPARTSARMQPMPPAPASSIPTAPESMPSPITATPLTESDRKEN